MGLADLVAASAIVAALLAMACFLFRLRRPATTATRATGRRSSASPASGGTTSGSPESVAASLSATSGYGAGIPAGHQPSDSCGHSAVSSSHVDAGGFSDSASCGSH